MTTTASPPTPPWLPAKKAAIAAGATFVGWVFVMFLRLPVVSQLLTFAWPYILMLSLGRWFPEFSVVSWISSVSLTAACAIGILSIANRFWRGRSVLLGIVAALLAMALATAIMQAAFPGAE